MIAPVRHPPTSPSGNGRSRRIILGAAGLSAAAVTVLALGGDLRERLPLYWTLSALLTLVMLAVWRIELRGPSVRRIVLVALVLRLLASLGEPALSDDVYRYVWDGRVQREGIHPYLFAPEGRALDSVPDPDGVRERVNHPELGTIYPPTAQLFFLAHAVTGAGEQGMRVALGMLDVGVVWLLIGLLRRRGRSPAHAVLYAWNPLAVLESSGSGHLEPLGVLLLLAALLLLERRRVSIAGAALAAAILSKLLPVLIVPALVRRLGLRGLLASAAAGVAIAAPYLLSGPAVGEGLFAYLGRWTHNGAIYEGLRQLLEWLDPSGPLKALLGWMQRQPLLGGLPYEMLYANVWPDRLARSIVAATALGAALEIARRRIEPLRAAYLVLGLAVVLAPTVHPWYALWVLPLAIVERSRAWLWLAATLPLAYAGEGSGVSWPILCVEYLPFLALWIVDERRVRVSE